MNVRGLDDRPNSADTHARATSLTGEANESSRSNNSASAPAAAAFGRKSSRLPGTNRRLRKFGSGHMWYSSFCDWPEPFDGVGERIPAHHTFDAFSQNVPLRGMAAHHANRYESAMCCVGLYRYLELSTPARGADCFRQNRSERAFRGVPAQSGLDRLPDVGERNPVDDKDFPRN